MIYIAIHMLKLILHTLDFEKAIKQVHSKMIIGILLFNMFYIDKTTYATIKNTSLTLQSPNCLCHLGWKQTHYKQCFSSINSRLPINSRTPLHIAARYGENECISTLLRLGSDMESKDKDGSTPLVLAAWKHHCSAIKILIHSGAKISNLHKKFHASVDKCMKIKSQSHSTRKYQVTKKKITINWNITGINNSNHLVIDIVLVRTN